MKNETKKTSFLFVKKEIFGYSQALKTLSDTIEISREKYEYFLDLEEKFTSLSSDFLTVSAHFSELQRMLFGSKS